jgi:hypothetical protein
LLPDSGWWHHGIVVRGSDHGRDVSELAAAHISDIFLVRRVELLRAEKLGGIRSARL